MSRQFARTGGPCNVGGQKLATVSPGAASPASISDRQGCLLAVAVWAIAGPVMFWQRPERPSAVPGSETTEDIVLTTLGRVGLSSPPFPAIFSSLGNQRTRQLLGIELAEGVRQSPVKTEPATPPQNPVRTISCYGYPGDSSGPATGFICAVPSSNSRKNGKWEWPRGTKLRLTKGSKSVIVVVDDVCSKDYWNRRVDLPREPYLALGGPRKWGLVKNVKVEVVRG